MPWKSGEAPKVETFLEIPVRTTGEDPGPPLYPLNKPAVRGDMMCLIDRQPVDADFVKAKGDKDTIVLRLRARWNRSMDNAGAAESLDREAADEIERLQALIRDVIQGKCRPIDIRART